MCGIWAIFGIPDYFKYINHARTIAARGPDCFRMETLPDFHNCCLAFHWLKTMHDMFGMQPMRVKNFPHVYLTYDGNIYNHEDLGRKYKFNYHSNTDGEVIIHLYDKFGVKKTAQLLDGVFALCIIDTKKREIHLARDTFGVRPLMTLSVEGNMSGICSEAKGLVPIVESLKQDGLCADVKHFLPGSYASYSIASDGITTMLKDEPYTYVGDLPHFETRLQPNASDVMQNIRDLFSEAVRKRTMSDKRIGCFLSGGLDSSLVAALLTKAAKEQRIRYPIQTFSIGMEGSSDVEAARKVSTHIGSEHHEVVITPEQGIQVLRQVIYTLESYDPSLLQGAVFHYLLTKYISEKTDTVVVYSGEGADSLFQGFLYYHRAPSPEAADEESRNALKEMYLSGGLRADRCTSVHGLELQLPFEDVHYSSYVLSLPAQMRQPKDGCEKWLLRASFDKTNLIPKEILWRTKVMFGDGASPSSPGHSWVDVLKEQLESQISDEAMAQAQALYPFNTPKTKDAFYYRQVFEEFFPGCSHLIPSMWKPKWNQ